MIRQILLVAFISGLAVFAFRDWYKSLCGLILLMAVIEHPDMPKSILGIQGLNPWNLLLMIIVVAWFLQRKNKGLTLDMPRKLTILLILYLLVILTSFGRMMADHVSVDELAFAVQGEIPSTAVLISEHLVNSLKWVVPALLLFDGCRSPERFLLGIFCVMGVYFLLSLQVIKWMPIQSVLSGDDLTARSLKILLNEVGYHRVNLSMMLAGASWAVFASSYLIHTGSLRAVLLAASLVVVFAQALTGGRTGYGTWLMIGIFMCLLRWRRYLLLVPFVVVSVVFIVPGVYERMTQGFSSESYDENPRLHDGAAEIDGLDLYTVTAGRNVAWPYVIEKIEGAPFVGHGRLAMTRTGIAGFLWWEFGESFPHPHNAYLELMLDNGLLGAIPVILFYLTILKYSISLFRDSRNSIFVAVGGATFALVAALLIASLGSQTFYPREGAVGMWCCIGLMLRVHLERSRAEETGSFGEGVFDFPWENTAAKK